MEIEFWIQTKSDFEGFLKTHRQDLRYGFIRENKEIKDGILRAVEVCKKNIMRADYEIEKLSKE